VPCVLQVYCRLINEWCSSGNVEAIPGFKRYAMEHLGGEACVLGLLRGQPPLDPRDAATLALLQDLAGALKLVNDKCGDDFAMHLLNVVAPAAGLPTALAQQLVYAVRSLEVKDIRDCLRSILQQAGQAAK
ncbi:tRNA exportin, partial [Haematococcus lacustris]